MNFKVGDKVTPKENHGKLKFGNIYTVSSVSGQYVRLVELKPSIYGWFDFRFKLVEATMKEERKPHKHAAVIKAWADGAYIEMRMSDENTWMETPEPEWDYDDQIQFRVKPPPPVLKSTWEGIGTTFSTHIHNDKSKAMSPDSRYLVERQFEDNVLVDVVVHKL